GESVIAQAFLKGRLFALDAVTSSSIALSASTAESTALWHFRYGHLSAWILHQLSVKEMRRMACSPSQANGDGNMYSSRHEHSLCSYKGLGPYECSGCKEYGANLGYKCRLCPDFILHEACAAIPDEYVHLLFTQLPLQFCSQTRLRHHCDGCGE
ncbi:hypothetical protein KI387_000850, partial [Taxus chinensis]